MEEETLLHIFDPFTRGEQGGGRLRGQALDSVLQKGWWSSWAERFLLKSRIGEGSSFCVELEFEEAQKGAVQKIKKKR